MTDRLLYHVLWRWIPTMWRIRIEDCWYWIIDAPMWQPPEYVICLTMRTKRDVSDQVAADEESDDG